MKVKKQYLLLIASLVWIIAGVNIVRIGFEAYTGYISVLNFFLSAVVFVVFQFFIFGRLVKKHKKRIIAYDEYLASNQSKKTIKVFDSTKVTKPLEDYLSETGAIYEDGRVYLSDYHYQKHQNYVKSLTTSQEHKHTT